MILGKMLLPLQGTTLKAGLVSCWEFDEASGSSIGDSFGSNALSALGTYLANQSGKIGTAYSLSIGAAKSSSRIVTAFPFTVSWWLKLNYGSVNRLSTNVFNTSYHGVEIGLDYNQCIVQFGNGGGSGSANRKSYSLTGAVATEVWHHVAVVVNSHGSFTYYLDNVVKTGFVASGSASSTSFSFGDLFIGKPWGSSTSYANCTGDQAALWNKALTADEIGVLYNSGNGLAFAQW